MLVVNILSSYFFFQDLPRNSPRAAINKLSVLTFYSSDLEKEEEKTLLYLSSLVSFSQTCHALAQRSFFTAPILMFTGGCVS